MDQIFEGDDTDAVVGLSRELLPASMVAASIVAALTGMEPEDQSRQIIQLAGRMSRDMAAAYLHDLAVRRSACPDLPPYGRINPDGEQRV